MRCNIKFKELSLYLDGRYTGKKSQALKKHIAECPHCREQLDRLRLLKASLADLTPVKESEGFDFEFNRLLQERLDRRKSPLRSWKVGLEGALARIRDSFVYPLPAAVKVAASFVVVMAVVWSVRAYAIHKFPLVEFVAGEVRIYRPSQKAWIAPEADIRLKSGDKIYTEEGAMLNIVSRNKYKARIKDKSIIVISKLQSGWRTIDTDFSLSYGNLLVNTTKEFKGSKMRILTPACDAEVVGTAFMVRVFENRTWLGVLGGRVKVISKAHPLKTVDTKEIATYVSSGQKVTIRPYLYPSIPELFSEKEWRMMQELYQLTEGRKIILLLGTGTDRIEELLRPAPVYIPGIKRLAVPKEIQRTIYTIIDAIKDGNYDVISKSAKELERLLERYPSPKYDVEILMFIASHYHYINDHNKAIRVFEKVIRDYPDSPFASLAQCGIATIYQKDIKDIRRAEKTYRQLLETYPDSVDAIRARETLSSIR